MSHLLLMSHKELSRLEVLQQLSEHRLTQRAAALRLSLSTRQLRRLCKASQQLGAMALISKRRARPSNHRLEAATRHAACALDRILCLVEERTLSPHLTFSYKRTLYQVETKRPAYALRHARVEVREHCDGTLRVQYKGQLLAHQVITEEPLPRASTPSQQFNGRVAKQPARKPSPTHPWKRHPFLTMKARRPQDQRGHLYLGQTADISILD